MIAFTVPYPPQANNMYTVARGRKIKSTSYRSWKLAAALHIAAHRQPRVPGSFAISIMVPRPDRRRRDLDNLCKPIMDAIVCAGVIVDDSLADSIRIAWSASDPRPGALVHVEIEPA